jgi:hypothetical protein
VSYKEDAFDVSMVESYRTALQSALATIRHWCRNDYEKNEELKSTLAKFIVLHAANGETDPQLLRKRALESYFLQQ